MSRFVLDNLPLVGLNLIERQRLGDDRGFLERLFCADELAVAADSINYEIVTRMGGRFYSTFLGAVD